MSKQAIDFTAVVAESQKHVLGALTQAHEGMLKVAELGTSSIPTATQLPWTMPKAKDLVQASYDFAGKVLEEQKAFATRMTEIAEERVDDGRKTVAQALAQE